MNRIIDYLDKCLDLEERQTLSEKINRLPDQTIQMILEKDNNYPSFRSMGYSNEDISNVNKKLSSLFIDINNYMIGKGITPLFTNPSDTYLSSQEYEHIISKQDEEIISPENSHHINK